MGTRTRIVTAATALATLAGLLTWPASPAAGQVEELFRPAGLATDWPACFRSEFGIDSIGCAVNDVPGGRANADNYVFLHGKAFLVNGQPIENLGYTSPFGQGESVGYVSIGGHTGFTVATLHSGEDGWWGVWVPVEQSDDQPTPPVVAWIGPMRSYPSLYNWIRNTPPVPPPFGTESDQVGRSSRRDAVAPRVVRDVLRHHRCGASRR